MKKSVLAIALLCFSISGYAQNKDMDRVVRLHTKAGEDKKLYEAKTLTDMSAALDSMENGIWLAYRVAKEDASLKNAAYAYGAYILAIYSNIMSDEKKYGSLIEFVQREDFLSYFDFLYDETEEDAVADYLLELPVPSSMPSRMDYNKRGFSNDAYTTNYTNSFYYAAIAASNVNDAQKDAIMYAEKALSTGKLSNNWRENMYLTLAFSYYKDKDANMLNTYTGYFIDNYVSELLTNDYFKSKWKILDSVMYNVDFGYSKSDGDGRLREKAARLYFNLKEYDLAYERINTAYRASNSAEMLWFKADVAKAMSDKAKVELTADQIAATDETVKIASWDWTRIADLYDLAGNSDKAAHARKMAKKTSGSNKVYISAGGQVVDFFNDVYPVALNLGYRRWDHELGFTYFDSTAGYRFPFKLKNPDPLVYKGYSLHYMPKRAFLRKLYIAPRFTYTSKECTQTTINTVNGISMSAMPTETSWDLTLNLGLRLRLIKRVSVDTYVGYGYGQRTFNPGIDLAENDKLTNPDLQKRIDEETFNPFYSGVRLWLYLFKI